MLSRRSISSLTGILLLGLGLLLLAGQQGWIEVGDLLATWWPLVLILAGLGEIATGRRQWPAVLLLVLGLAFLLVNLGLLRRDRVLALLPLILIGAGLLLLRRSWLGGRRKL